MAVSTKRVPGVDVFRVPGSPGSVGSVRSEWRDSRSRPIFEGRSTSARTMRPPGPLPEMAWRSMPCSRAMALASGEALIRRSPDLLGVFSVGVTGAGPGGGVASVGVTGADPGGGVESGGVAGVGSDAVGTRGVAVSPGLRNRAITVPMGTVCRASTSIRSSSPSSKASRSIVALSVSTSASTSPRSTWSPGCLSQATMVPSSMVSLRRGMVISIIGSAPWPALRGAALRGAALRGATFQGAALRGATFRCRIPPRCRRWPR